MKKLLLLASVATLVACSSESVRNDIVNNNEVAIDFTKVFIEKNTKGVYSSGTDLQSDGFGVFASKTNSSNQSSQVFGQLTDEQNAGTMVSYSSSAWTYSPTSRRR